MDNCKLYPNSCILSGVKIGKNTLLVAGSVVTKSFGDYLILGELPTKFIKALNHK